MPLKIENSKDRVVTTVFSEIRYKKDGSTDSNNFYERIYFFLNHKKFTAERFKNRFF